MSAVATKPRTSAPRRSRPAPPSIARPDVLANVLEDIRRASEKIHMALEAADHGSPAHQLLRLVTMRFLPAPLAYVAREPLTSNDVEAAYQGFFDVLAALAGAVALSDGEVIHSTLVEAHEMLDAAHSMLDSTAVVATSLPAAKPDADFIRGRDLAMQLVNEGPKEEAFRECFRAHRIHGEAQDNLFKNYLHQVIETPALIDGFSAVITTVLACQGEGIPASYFADLTLAETQAGAKGADGTKTFDEPGDQLADEATDPMPSTLPLAAELQLWREAMAVAGLSAGSDPESGLLRGAIVLMGLAEKEIESAATQHDGVAVSLAMCHAIAVLHVSGRPGSNNCALSISAAISLASLAKNGVDSMITELPCGNPI